MRSQKFRWFAGVVVALYLVTLVFFFKLPYSSSSIFQDVPADHWALYDIEYMYNHGWMKGRDAEVWNFYPEKPMARAELVALMLKVDGVDLTKLPKPDKQVYADVPLDNWASPVLAEAAKEHKIPFKDIQNGNFKPDESVTRGELAEAVVETLDIKTTTTGNEPFTDTKGSPYEPAIRALYEQHLANGNSDGTFTPQEPATRAQVANLFAKSIRAVRPDTQPKGGDK